MLITSESEQPLVTQQHALAEPEEQRDDGLDRSRPCDKHIINSTKGGETHQIKVDERRDRGRKRGFLVLFLFSGGWGAVKERTKTLENQPTQENPCNLRLQPSL